MIKRIKMSATEWREYVKLQLDKPRDHATYLRVQVARAVPFSVIIAVLASATTIYFWGFKEYARMVLQLLLTLTLAAALLGPMLRRLEEKFK